MPQIINTNTTLTQVNIAEQKAKIIATYQAMINGINAELGNTTTFLLSGGTYAKADLIARFQARIDAARKTLADRTTLHATVAAEQSLDKAVAALRTGFKTYLQGRYGKESPALQKFGFIPQKPTQRAAATKAKAVTLNTATRKARGTTGKKAKVLIKGAPAPTAPVAPTAPTAPTAPAAPPAPVTAGGAPTAPPIVAKASTPGTG
jgi:hypothetical protein